MAVQCARCGGSGTITEPFQYDEYDSKGKKTTKTGTKYVTCKPCGGKGYVG
jgi:hypothetical protein